MNRDWEFTKKTNKMECGAWVDYSLYFARLMDMYIIVFEMMLLRLPKQPIPG